MTGEAAIEAIALEKSYGDVRVLDGVDLRVERGTVFALLGPNGAGKTTTVRILATLIRPDAGRARVAGFDVVADRRRVRRAISLTGQYAARRRAADGRGEPADDGPADRPVRRGRPGARRGAARPVRPRGRGAAAGSAPTPAACGGASTSRRRSSAVPR